MDNRKMNLDRSPVSSEQIQAKQNFDAILSNYKLLKKPFYKSKWFWGTTGLATFGLVMVFGLNNFKSNTAYDDKTTLTNSEFKTIILPEDTPCILPVKENAAPFDLYTVLPLKGDTLILKDGSEIIVPAGSLLAKDLHEPVKIKTRVFRDKASAFLAGIKMDVAEGAFESAGMIEIRFEQNNKTVVIHPDKPIEVNLALHKPSASFNFYHLNEKTKEWEDTPCEFSDREEGGTTLVNSELDKTIKDELVEIKKDLAENQIRQDQLKERLPTKEAYNIPTNEERIFDLDYDLSDYPELRKLKDVKFEALPNQKNFNRVVNTTWSEMDLNVSHQNKFTLTFSNSKTKEILKVRPVLSGGAKQNALELFAAVKKDIDQQIKVLRVEKQELIKQEVLKQQQLAQLVKNFEVNTRSVLTNVESFAPNSAVQIMQATASFRTTRNGVFNADKPVNYPKALPIHLAFIKSGVNFRPRNVYIFDNQKDVRYSYGLGNKSINEIGLNNGEQLIIVIDINNQVAYSKVNKKQLLEQNSSIINVTLIEQEDLNETYIRKLLNEKQIQYFAQR